MSITHTRTASVKGEILLVDDNADNLRVLTRVLKENGHNVRQVTSGERALEAVERKAPNLILLDIQMPGMDGFHVCRLLKSRPETQTIPIIFITALSNLSSKVAGFAAGGVDYITKPFQVEEVLARVVQQLEIQQLNKDLARRNRQLDQILSGLPIPYIVTLPDGRIHNGNAHAEDLFKVRASEISSLNAIQFYENPADRKGIVETVLSTGFLKNREVRLKTRCGRSFWCLISASLLELDEGPGIFIGLTDITAQKEMESKFEYLSMTDSLTGIFNRRAFFTIAQREAERAWRRGSSLAVLQLDIDHFKCINDTWGHETGDRALEHFVSVIQGNLRASDVLGRMGGEEFALVLSESDRLQAHGSAERLRQAVSESSLVLDQGEAISYTVSCGITLWLPGEALDAALRRADKALYSAKHSGRNRVIFYTTDLEAP